MSLPQMWLYGCYSIACKGTLEPKLSQHTRRQAASLLKQCTPLSICPRFHVPPWTGTLYAPVIPLALRRVYRLTWRSSARCAWGRPRTLRWRTGQATVAYTGGMLAHSADAVVMVENTQTIDATSIEVLRPVAPGENVIQVGEDVQIGEVIVPAGCLLRPQDIGGLLALGITQVQVRCQPRVAIVSTGDEIVAPDTTPAPGQIRDINTYTIAALVEQAGGVPVPMGVVKDDYEAQRQAAVDGAGPG